MASDEKEARKTETQAVLKAGRVGGNILETKIFGPLAERRGYKYQIFPWQTNAHRIFRGRVRFDGSWCSGEAHLRRGLENYFQHLFSKSRRWWIGIEREVLKQLGEEDSRGFKRPFGEEEIWIIFGELGRDKAQVLDGFTLGFWQKL